MNKSKKMLLTILAIVSLVIITVGISYAFFNYVKQGTTENSITTGTITFLYTEVSEVGKGIKIQDALPMTEEQGKIQTGEGKIFDFKIASTTTNNVSIPYEVTARKKADSTLDESAVKVYLTEVDGNEQEVLLDNYSNLPTTSVKVLEGVVEKTIYTGIVPANSDSYEKNFKLRMWLDGDVDFSPVKDENGNDTYPYNGKTFTLTVNVYANGEVVTGDLSKDNTLKSLSVSDCTFDKKFNNDINDYSCTVPNSVKEVSVSAMSQDQNTKISGTGIKKLSVGSNTILVRTIAKNGTERIFTIKINRKELSETISIFGKIYDVSDNEATLTTTSVIADENGLYKSYATNSKKPTYYFRGNVENNYVSFAGFTWRIVRINEDGTIRLIMQDGINNNATYKFNSNGVGDNMKSYYTNSQIKPVLDSWYENNIGNNINYSNKVATGNYYCEQARVKSYYANKVNNAVMEVFSNYTPTFTCETDANGMGEVSSTVGLLTYDELIHAGGYNTEKYELDSNIGFYLYNPNISWWTMSPAACNSYVFEWVVSTNRKTGTSIAIVDSNYGLRPVINLKDGVIATGSGSISDPYLVQ